MKKDKYRYVKDQGMIFTLGLLTVATMIGLEVLGIV